MKISLNHHLPGLSLPIFLLLMILLGIFVGLETRNLIIQDNNNRLITIAETKTQRLSTYLQGQEELVSLLAASQVFRDFLGQTPTDIGYQNQKTLARKRILRSIEQDQNFIDIFLLDSAGIVSLSANREFEEGQNKSTEEYFIKGKNGIFINDIYLSPTVREVVYTLSAPIINDQDSQLLGVVIIRVRPNAVYEIVSNRDNISQTGETYLTNEDRIFLTPSYYWGDRVILDEIAECENARLCFDPQEVNRIEKGLPNVHLGHDNPLKCTDYRGVEVIGAHSYIPKVGWCLISKMDQSELSGSIRRIMATYSLFWLLITITLYLLLLSVVRKINQTTEEKTYRHLADSANQVGIGAIVGHQSPGRPGSVVFINDTALSALGYSSSKTLPSTIINSLDSGFIVTKTDKKIPISISSTKSSHHQRYSLILLGRK